MAAVQAPRGAYHGNLSFQELEKIDKPTHQKLTALCTYIDKNDVDADQVKSVLAKHEARINDVTNQLRGLNNEKKSSFSTLNQLEQSVGSFQGRYLNRQSAMVQSVHRKVTKLSQNPQDAASAIEIPQPYYEDLCDRYHARLSVLTQRVDEAEKALIGYTKERTCGANQDSVLRSLATSFQANYIQYRSIASNVTRLDDQIEEVRQLVARNRGVTIPPAYNLRNNYGIVGSGCPRTSLAVQKAEAIDRIRSELSTLSTAQLYTQQQATTNPLLAAQAMTAGSNGVLAGTNIATGIGSGGASSIFGNPTVQNTATTTGGGLFGNQPTGITNTTGTSSFNLGGLNNLNQPAAPVSGFGSTTHQPTGTTGVFGTQPTTTNFGVTNNGQNKQAFGNSTNQPGTASFFGTDKPFSGNLFK